jgi:hypothetical protein
MYDLDHLYYKENPDFRAFVIYSSILSFPNKYLNYFSEGAYEKKIDYITTFYKNFNGELDREYPYFTKLNMNDFVEKAINEIQPSLKAAMSCWQTL